MADKYILIRIVIILVGYCFGLIQSGYYYGIIHGIDIRKKGSGNVGATNTLRVLGTKAGIIVLGMDFLKAFIPCFITGLVWKEAPIHLILMLYMGLGVELGHNFPAQLGFKGGKGVASAAGMLFAIDWKLGLILVTVFALIAIFTRLVSLASISCMMLFIILVLLFANQCMEVNLLVIVIAGMSIVRHASNIERLLKGTEHKL